jgi:hypothetical protein
MILNVYYRDVVKYIKSNNLQRQSLSVEPVSGEVTPAVASTPSTGSYIPSLIPELGKYIYVTFT